MKRDLYDDDDCHCLGGMLVASICGAFSGALVMALIWWAT